MPLFSYPDPTAYSRACLALLGVCTKERRKQTRCDYSGPPRKRLAQTARAEFCSNPNFASRGNGWTSDYIGCDECSWKEKNFLICYPIGPDWRMDRYAFWRSHARHQKGAYICRICSSVVKGSTEFQKHLRNHGIDKIKRAYGDSAVTRTPRPDGMIEEMIDGIGRYLFD
ncbi:hypothetical protein ONZ43_g883 [Nemania bipapillata]|uniref:Uncharacterized protein n=1 Tax=Nemania bipapillata TaxID=110536 RepID=A0ACC2J6M8_9PEZI|nr:hypothetical protein ONZ43_g883 [Nemania bipapillata]